MLVMCRLSTVSRVELCVCQSGLMKFLGRSKSRAKRIVDEKVRERLHRRIWHPLVQDDMGGSALPKLNRKDGRDTAHVTSVSRHRNGGEGGGRWTTPDEFCRACDETAVDRA